MKAGELKSGQIFTFTNLTYQKVVYICTNSEDLQHYIYAQLLCSVQPETPLNHKDFTEPFMIDREESVSLIEVDFFLKGDIYARIFETDSAEPN